MIKILLVLGFLSFSAHSFSNSTELNEILSEIDNCSSVKNCDINKISSRLDREIERLRKERKNEFRSLYKAKAAILTLQRDYNQSEKYLKIAEKYLSEKKSIDLANTFSINFTRFFNELKYDEERKVIEGDLKKAYQYLIRLLKSEHHDEENWIRAYSLASAINIEESDMHEMAVADFYYNDALKTLKSDSHIETYLISVHNAYYKALLFNARFRDLNSTNRTLAHDYFSNNITNLKRFSEIYKELFGIDKYLYRFYLELASHNPDYFVMDASLDALIEKSRDKGFRFLEAWFRVMSMSLGTIYLNEIDHVNSFYSIENYITDLEVQGNEVNSRMQAISTIKSDFYSALSFYHLRKHNCHEAINNYKKLVSFDESINLVFTLGKLDDFGQKLKNKCL